MKILADEGVDRSIVETLRALGFDVVWIAEYQPGLPDIQVLQLAQNDGRLLVTYDKDFGALVFAHGYQIPGVVLLRFSGLSADAKKALTRQLLGCFTVITPRGARLRPL